MSSIQANREHLRAAEGAELSAATSGDARDAAGTGEARHDGPLAARRLAIASGILTLLLAADALYMQLSKYGGDDHGNFNMSFATTMWIATAILCLVTVGLFLTAARRRHDA